MFVNCSRCYSFKVVGIPDRLTGRPYFHVVVGILCWSLVFYRGRSLFFANAWVGWHIGIHSRTLLCSWCPSDSRLEVLPYLKCRMHERPVTSSAVAPVTWHAPLLIKKITNDQIAVFSNLAGGILLITNRIRTTILTLVARVLKVAVGITAYHFMYGRS